MGDVYAATHLLPDDGLHAQVHAFTCKRFSATHILHACVDAVERIIHRFQGCL